MSVESVLLRGRTMAELRMTDTCRITKPGTGDRVLNPVTRKYEDPPPVTVYEGKCRIPHGATSARSRVAEQTYSVGEYPFDLPVTPETCEVAAGMTVTYLTAPNNPSLVGMVLGVTEQVLLSQGTKLRFKIKTTVSM